MFDLGSFGDGNPYTVVSHDLKSVLTDVPNLAWSGLALVGSGLPPVVSDRGTMFVDANGAEAGYRFSTMAASLAQTHYEGHIKLRCERDWLCAPEASSNGNTGATLASAQKAISALATSGPTTAIGLLNRTTTLSATVAMPAAAGTTLVRKDFRSFKIANDAQAVLHTAGKLQDVDVDIFWKGNYAFFAVDGFVANATNLRSVTGATPWTNIFNYFYLGSDRGVANSFASGHWFSNFEIRTKCPEFSCSYPHRSIGVLSDSLFDSENVAAATAGDVSAQHRMQRKLNAQGQYCNITISENSGYRIYNTGANWLGDTAPIAAALANHPVTAYVCGGTNDAIYTGTEITTMQFQAAYLDILEKLLGENGNVATSVEIVKCLIPIPLMGANANASYATWVTRAAGYRSIINSLPAIWDATYPVRAGAVHILDTFTALGGETNKMGNDLYKGQLTGSLTDLHLGAHGMQIFGDFIASKL